MGQQTVRKAREKGVYFVKHDAGEHSWKVSAYARTRTLLT